MNDVRDICERILDRPAPSPRSGSQVLAIARQAARRRNRLAVGAAGVVTGALVTVIVATAATSGLSAPGQSDRQATAAASTPASPPPVPAMPASNAHGSRIAELLTAAVPGGYTTQVANGGTTVSWLLDQESESDRYASQTRILMSKEDGQGLLSAVIVRDNGPAATGDLCSAAVAERLRPYTDGSALGCEVIIVDGVPIRTATESGQTMTATRFLTGGLLMIRSARSTDPTGGPPTDAAHPWYEPLGQRRGPLVTAPLSTRQLAELAANPGLLP